MNKPSHSNIKGNIGVVALSISSYILILSIVASFSAIDIELNNPEQFPALIGVLIITATIYHFVVIKPVLFGLKSNGDNFKVASETDPLTGLKNRAALAKEFESTSPQQSFFLLVDIDHFKQVNDTYGHIEGDRVLKHIARFLKQNVRSTDDVYRIGGEEFAIKIKNASVESAANIGNKLVSGIRDLPILTTEEEKDITVTLTIGLSKIEDGQSLESCLKVADERLYKGKRSGRNRLVNE